MDTMINRMLELEDYGKQISNLTEQILQHKERLDGHSKQLDELHLSYLSLTSQQTATKTLVEGLYGRFEGLETRLFGVFQQMTKDNAHLLHKMTLSNTQERQEVSQERTMAHRAWLSFTKYVIGGTIIAMITYVFSKGM